MKESIFIKLCIFFFIANFFISNAESQESYKNESSYHIIIEHDKNIIDASAVLHSIIKMSKDIEDHYSENLPLDESYDNEEDNCLTDILTILIGTYEKIVGATVTYYLMINLPVQYNLHQRIAMILAEDLLKIMPILGKYILRYIFNQNLTMWEKYQYCACIIGIIIIIKLGIDRMPQAIQSQQPPIFTQSHNGESGYVNDKFNNYR